MEKTIATMIKNECKKRNKTIDEVIDNIISIGFCQPKFYEPNVWIKSKKVMLYLVGLDIGIVHRPIYGAGHFWTNDEHINIRNKDNKTRDIFFRETLKDKLSLS